jgi:hypothetical protein
VSTPLSKPRHFDPKAKVLNGSYRVDLTVRPDAFGNSASGAATLSWNVQRAGAGKLKITKLKPYDIDHAPGKPPQPLSYLSVANDYNAVAYGTNDQGLIFGGNTMINGTIRRKPPPRRNTRSCLSGEAAHFGTAPVGNVAAGRGAVFVGAVVWKRLA